MQCGFSCKVTRLTQNQCLKCKNWVIFPNKMQYTWCEYSPFTCVLPHVINSSVLLRVLSLCKWPVLGQFGKATVAQWLTQHKKVLQTWSGLTEAFPSEVYMFLCHRTHESSHACKKSCRCLCVFGMRQEEKHTKSNNLHHPPSSSRVVQRCECVYIFKYNCSDQKLTFYFSY